MPPSGQRRAGPGRDGAARLFLSLPVPTGAHAGVSFSIAALKRKLPQLRWEPHAKWHVSLRFIGDTARWRIPAIAALTGAVAARHAPVELAATWLSTLPDPPRGVGDVLAIRLADSPALDALAEDLSEALAREGLAGQRERRLLAHITVARNRGRRPVPLPATPLRCQFHFQADALWLVESQLRRDGAWHDAIGRWTLGAAEPAPEPANA